MPAAQIDAICRRAVGAPAESVTELGLGSYNSTYRLDFADRARAVLRVAPERARQYRSERELMRAEYAALPYLSVLGRLVPRTIAADFTHDLISRDYLVQELLPGVPAPRRLDDFAGAARDPFYARIGEIARTIHGVSGVRFGPVGGPPYDTWSAALLAYFADVAADCAASGLDATDVRAVVDAVGRHRGVLDEVTEPRLTHGDLWTVNLLLDADADRPVVTGVLDGDRGWWADPPSDWTIFMATRREREAFWDGYGQQPPSPSPRLHVYRARHICAIRLERHRLGADVAGTYPMLAAELAALS